MIGRGKEDGGQPDAFHAEAPSGGGISVVEIIHAIDDAPEIADAVAVGIGEGAHKDLIEHPMIVLHVQARSFRRGYAE